MQILMYHYILTLITSFRMVKHIFQLTQIPLQKPEIKDIKVFTHIQLFLTDRSFKLFTPQYKFKKKMNRRLHRDITLFKSMTEK